MKCVIVNKHPDLGQVFSLQRDSIILNKSVTNYLPTLLLLVGFCFVPDTVKGLFINYVTQWGGGGKGQPLCYAMVRW